MISPRSLGLIKQILCHGRFNISSYNNIWHKPQVGTAHAENTYLRLVEVSLLIWTVREKWLYWHQHVPLVSCAHSIHWFASVKTRMGIWLSKFSSPTTVPFALQHRKYSMRSINSRRKQVIRISWQPYPEHQLRGMTLQPHIIAPRALKLHCTLIRQPRTRVFKSSTVLCCSFSGGTLVKC